MFKNSIAAIAAAAVITVGTLAAMPASAHEQRQSKPSPTVMNPNDVWVGNEFAGRDPDPNVRLELRRTFGSTE